MKPPNHLSLESRGWWRKIEKEWKLDDAAYILLKSCLESYDVAEAARILIAKEGLVIKTPSGMFRPHPAVSIMKVAKQNFLQSFRMLNFGVEPPGPLGRPPEGGKARYAHD